MNMEVQADSAERAGTETAGEQNTTTAKEQGGETMQPCKGQTSKWILLVLAMIIAGILILNRDFWMSFWSPVPLAGPYQITAAEYKGIQITKEGATFEARFKIKIVQREGWKRIGLLSSKVAIVKAELPSGAYLVLSDGNYAILTKKTGDIEASLVYSVAVTEKEGSHEVEFPRVASVTCLLDAVLPEENLDVLITGAQSIQTAKTNGTTHVTAALPDNTPIKLSWKKELPKLAEGPSQIHCETRTLISVGEGLLLGQTKIDFSILHTPTHTLEMKVPQGVSVVEVIGKDVRDWRVADGKMVVQLEKETIGLYNLSIKYETAITMASGRLVVPTITGSGVESEKGDIGVVALTSIEVKNANVTSAHVIDVKDLPPEIISMTAQPVLLAYRYAAPGFAVTLDVGKPSDVGVLLTMIDRAHFTVVQTLDGKRVIRAVYNVRNNRNQFLRLQIPRGAELWSVSVAGRSSQASKDETGRILLPLIRSQGGGGMSAFPVEIVYTEEGTKPDDRGRGTAKVELPVCSEPIMHLMVSLYAPEQGKYMDFEGTMRKVEQFTAMGSAPVVLAKMPVNAMVNQQAVIHRVEPGAGAPSDIEVQLPVSGKPFLLEKILVVKDQQWFSYGYKNLVK